MDKSHALPGLCTALRAACTALRAAVSDAVVQIESITIYLQSVELFRLKVQLYIYNLLSETKLHLSVLSLVSTEWHSLVWCSMVHNFYAIPLVPNNRTVPYLSWSPFRWGTRWSQKGHKRVELHTLQSVDCKQAKSCF